MLIFGNLSSFSEIIQISRSITYRAPKLSQGETRASVARPQGHE